MLKLKETDMYGPLQAWLSANGQEVFAEVDAGAARADIVCKKENIFTIVEMKTSMNLEFLEQAYNWRNKAHYVYVAVPMKANNRNFATMLLKGAGIGILLLDISTGTSDAFCSRICVHLAPQIFRKITVPWNDILLPEFKINIGGSNDKSKIKSKYKVMMDHIRLLLQRHPGGMSIDDLAVEVSGYYANPKASLYNALTKYESAWCEKFKDPETYTTCFRLLARETESKRNYFGKVMDEAQRVDLDCCMYTGKCEGVSLWKI